MTFRMIFLDDRRLARIVIGDGLVDFSYFFVGDFGLAVEADFQFGCCSGEYIFYLHTFAGEGFA